MVHIPVKSTFVDAFNVWPVEITERIVKQFHRSYRPLFLGQVASEVGLSLERTEMMLQSLVELGVLREATQNERRDLDVGDDASVWVLTAKRSLSLAGW